MPDRMRAVRERIRTLFGRAGENPPAEPGEPALMSAAEAIRHVESMLSERNCGSVAEAEGSTLGGLRTSVFLAGLDVERARSAIAASAARRSPLVVHAALDGAGSDHSAYHGLVGTGAFLVFPVGAQEAVDATLAARAVAELSLTPGVIAIDGRETADAITDLHLPGEAFALELVGRAGDTVESPTPAQRLLFGERRRRLVRWFDPDRPVAIGARIEGGTRASARIGRAKFFEEHVRTIGGEVLAALSARTGRAQGFLREHRLADAEYVLVAQGAVVETAEAVADRLREAEGQRIGVLGIRWLRPFPTEAVRRALEGARSVAVLERVGASFGGGPPLLAEVEATLGSRACATFAVSYGLGGGQPEAGRLAEVCRHIRQAGGTRTLCLDVEPPTTGSSFPRREALLQQVQRDYADLELCAVPRGEPLGVVPDGTIAVSVSGPETRLDDATLRQTAAAMQESFAHVRARWNGSPAGIRVARLLAAPTPLREPGAGAPADLAIVCEGGLRGDLDAIFAVKRRGVVLLEWGDEPAGAWLALPAPWRSRVREHELHLFCFTGNVADGIRRGLGALSGGEVEGIVRIEWRELAEPPEPVASQALPSAVRRFDRPGNTYDNVSRFWGEVVQPRIEGELREVADPFVALGAVPASTAAFQPAQARRPTLPAVDPARCTGCGRCWTSCPDSAIATVALGVEAWLDACADAVQAENGLDAAAAGKLRRVHRQWAARVERDLAAGESALLDDATVRRAAVELLDKMNPGASERAAMTAVVEAMSARASRLPLVVTDLMFQGLRGSDKGGGVLLGIAFDPRACQACGVCAESCPEEAITLEARTDESIDRARGALVAWESLPDTSGDVVTRISAVPEIGSLAGVLTSRHCAYALVGGPGSEAGSGARLVVRQLTAVAEYVRQREALSRTRDLGELASGLREAVSQEMSRGIQGTDLESLEAALADPRATAPVADVLARLEEVGERSELDLDRLRGMVRSVREIDRLRWELSAGPEGQGRARFGVMASGPEVVAWAGVFPRNPFGAPVVVDLEGEGAALASGILAAELQTRLEEVRAVRRARLHVEAPADIATREREVEALRWEDLDPDERRAAEPLILLADATAIDDRRMAGLSRLMRSGLPVKIVLLDGRSLDSAAADPTLLALAHRRAFVLSASPAHPDHLFRGLAEALDFPGSAVVHLHAPSPREHGFDPAKTLERARDAVRCRVHPLLRYDPTAEGVFGARIDLAGNPDPAQAWASADGEPADPAAWAFGEARYRDQFDEGPDGRTVPLADWCLLSSDERGAARPIFTDPEGRRLVVGEKLAHALLERASHWRTLQELAGVVTPFADTVRRRAAEELEQAHRAEIETLVREHRAEIAELETASRAAHASRLRDRLLELAGYRPPRRRD